MWLGYSDKTTGEWQDADGNKPLKTYWVAGEPKSWQYKWMSGEHCVIQGYKERIYFNYKL